MILAHWMISGFIGLEGSDVEGSGLVGLGLLLCAFEFLPMEFGLELFWGPELANPDAIRKSK